MSSFPQMVGTEEARLLVDIGFMALSRGLNDMAAQIFAAVEVARPDGEAGRIGAALVDMARGRLDEAASRLRAMPGSDEAQAFLGMALARMGDRQAATETLERLVRTVPDTAAAALARDMLSALETSGDLIQR